MTKIINIHLSSSKVLRGGDDQNVEFIKKYDILKRGGPRVVMVKVMDCVVREFVLQSHYYFDFRANILGKVMNPLILPPMGYNASLLFF